MQHLQVINGFFGRIFVIQTALVGVDCPSLDPLKYSWTRTGDKWFSGSHVACRFEKPSHLIRNSSFLFQWRYFFTCSTT